MKTTATRTTTKRRVSAKKSKTEKVKVRKTKADTSHRSPYQGGDDGKTWNSMSHLSIKRFSDDDPSLTAGAKRDRIKHPCVAKAELDPSGRAVCKLCGDRIPKGALRLCLFLECHKGYRNICTLHSECFWKHPETVKLESVDEIAMDKTLDDARVEYVHEQFSLLLKRKETTK